MVRYVGLAWVVVVLCGCGNSIFALESAGLDDSELSSVVVAVQPNPVLEQTAYVLSGSGFRNDELLTFSFADPVCCTTVELVASGGAFSVTRLAHEAGAYRVDILRSTRGWRSRSVTFQFSVVASPSTDGGPPGDPPDSGTVVPPEDGGVVVPPEDGGNTGFGTCPAGQEDFYGTCVATLKLFGQTTWKEASRDTVSGHSLYHGPGVVVDTSSKPNRIYVADTGNSRVLAFKALGTCRSAIAMQCTNDSDCPSGDSCAINALRDADLILGQPDSEHAACNGDVNVGLLGKTSATSMCLLEYPVGTNTAEQWGAVNFSVDDSGDLYFPDFFNNRVLVFREPLSADTSLGRGDAVPDLVLGQEDFESNRPNRGMAQPDARSLRLHAFVSTRGGTSVDLQGNVWIADSGNHRVLRFPPGSKTADLVLGQASFTSADYSYCSPPQAPAFQLNKICNPTMVKLDPYTGDLYVVDETSTVGAFGVRILVFHPPFSNGMAAARTLAPNYSGPVPGYADPYYLQATGLEINTYRTGPYASGVLWVTEHAARRALLLDGNGNILEVIGAQNASVRGGDSPYWYPGCGTVYEGYRLGWPHGVSGFDDDSNIYLADEWFSRVSRYKLPYDPVAVGTSTCLPNPSGGFLQGNGPGPAKISEVVGAIARGNQLIVKDNARLLVWNNYMNKPLGANADVVVGQPSFTTRSDTSHALGARAFHVVDDKNRLWTANAHGPLVVYQLPFAAGAVPLKNFVTLSWADDGQPIPYQTVSVAFDPLTRKMWIVNGNRLLRVSNVDDFATGLRVDQVIGQSTKTENKCNRGQALPDATTLCNALQAKFDKAGNLYVVEGNYECHANDRIVVYSAADLAAATGMFPNLAAKKVFDRRFTGNFSMSAQCGISMADVNRPFSPVSIAFNSRNELVVGNDGYYPVPEERAAKQIYLYRNPLTKQAPDFSIRIPVGASGEVNFDERDRLIVQDHTWYRVWVIDPEEMDEQGKPVWLVPTGY